MVRPSGPTRARLRFASWAQRARDPFPLTAPGLALGALAGLTFWFVGVKRLDLVLLTAAVLLTALMGALLLVALPVSFFLRRRMRAAAPSSSATGVCGQWLATGFRVPLPWWLPFLQARVEWVTPSGVETDLDEESGEERIRCARRGEVVHVTRRMVLGDLLGLVSFAWRAEHPAALRVLPARAAFDRPEIIRGLTAGEDLWDPFGERLGDRVDLRNYAPGDPLRMILWKVYARTRQLVVRLPEPALEAAPRLCAYLPAHEADEPAARLSRTLLEDGLLGEGWRFGTDGADAAETLQDALQALARSGSVPPGAPSGFAAFLQRAKAEGFGTCLLLLPAHEGPWLAEVASALTQVPMRVHVLLTLEGWQEIEGPRWKRWLLRQGPRRGAEAASVARTMALLEGPDLRFTLVDTERGLVLENPAAYVAKRAAPEGAPA